MPLLKEQSVIHDTFVLERSYPVAPEKVFAAFADPAKKRRWYADGSSHVVQEYRMDFRVGGTEVALYRLKEGGPVGGMELGNDTLFHDVVPNRRIVFASTMTLGGIRISVTLATVELIATEKGTDMIFTHQGAFFENSGGPKMRQDGWVKLFEQLEKALNDA